MSAPVRKAERRERKISSCHHVWKRLWNSKRWVHECVHCHQWSINAVITNSPYVYRVVQG